MINAREFNIKNTRRRLKAEIASFSRGMSTRADEAILPLSYAKNTYNFSCEDGALKNGLGLELFDEVEQGESVGAVFLFRRFDANLNERDDRILFFTHSGRIYHRRAAVQEALMPLEGAQLTSIPMAVNYRLYSEDVVIICSESDNMLIWNGVDAPYFVEDSPKISSIALHFERLFATVDGEKSAVWFSQDLDPTNWELSLDAGGFIQMLDERGALNKVVSYLNNVYVFRDYGISRITAYAEQQEFSVSQLFVAGGRIYPKSVAVCGEQIIFLAEDGLFGFNGSDTYKLFNDLDGLFEVNADSVAAYNSGKYVCALRMKFKDNEKVGCENADYKNNALICYDIHTREVTIMRGVDIECLFGYSYKEGGEILCSIRGDNKVGRLGLYGEIFGEPTKKCWQTPYSDFGYPDKKKHLSAIYVLCEHNALIEVTTDRVKKTFEVLGKKEVSEIKCALSFRQIEFKFLSENSKARIVKPCALFSVER